uniref:F-box domain-containing protein n=1 Tax=Caenorhabditis japonica TaxID=281687 RepID=A0A8R1I3X7_CAEJA
MLKKDNFWIALPEHFKRDVIGKLDYNSRCCLRMCSIDDQNLVDSCPVALKSVAIALGSSADIRITDGPLQLAHTSENEEDVVQAFLPIFKHHKSEIEKLEIVYYDEFCYNQNAIKSLVQELESLVVPVKREFPLKVYKFQWYCHSKCYPKETFQRILNCIDPTRLESIYIHDPVLFERNSEIPKKVGICRKEIFIANPVSFSDLLMSADKFSVKLKSWNADNVANVIKAFLARDPPIGSSFDISALNKILVTDIFKKCNVRPKDEPMTGQ